MTARPNLRVIPDAPEPQPSIDYEWKHRQRIASKDWSRIHIRGDRNPPLDWWPRVRRTWRA